MSGDRAEAALARYQSAREVLVGALAENDVDALQATMADIEDLLSLPVVAELPDDRRAAVIALAAAGRQRLFDLTGDSRQRDDAIELLDVALTLAHPDDPNRFGYASNAATLRTYRYDEHHEGADLEEAIRLFDSVAELAAPAGVQIWAHNLGQALLQRAAAAARGDLPAAIDGGSPGDPAADLDRAVEMLRQAVAIPPNDASAETGSYATTLAQALRRRAELRGADDLVEAAEVARTAARLTAGGPDEANAYTTLGQVLVDLAERRGQEARPGPEAVDAPEHLRLIDEAVAAHRAALACGEAGASTPKLATDLANALAVRYDLTSDLQDLDEAVELLAGAEAAGGPTEEQRRVVLHNLGALLIRQFERLGDVDVLDRALELLTAALALGASLQLHHNLGVALMASYRRYVRPELLDGAIAHLELALTGDGPGPAASASSLGNALFLRYGRQDDPADLDRSIAAHRRSVNAAQPGSHDQAVYRGNLAVSLTERFRRSGDPSALNQALTESAAGMRAAVPTAPDTARLYAGVAETLAEVANLTGRRRDERRARAVFQLAAQRVADLAPEQILGTALSHGDWELAHGRWSEARAAYGPGQAGARRLFDTNRSAISRESWLRAVDGLPQALAFACARDGAPAAAVDALETGRMLLLAEALGPGGGGPGRTLEGASVVWLAATAVGGLALLAACGTDAADPDRTRIRPIPLESFDHIAVEHQVERLQVTYAQRRSDRGAWRRALAGCTQWLDEMIRPLTSTVPPGELVLIPTGAVARLPWQLTGLASEGRNRRAAAFAPSLNTLGDPTAAGDLRRGAMLAVADPAGTGLPPLRFSPAELGPAELGPPPRLLVGPDATRDRVLEEMAAASVLHIAVHGRADPVHPRRSSIVLAGGEELTVDTLVDEGLLTGTMVVLASCESAVPGPDLPDELIGLPAAFLQAGATAVIGAQWAVAHAATTALMHRFYANWRAGHTAVRSLAAAQAWTAAASNAQVGTVLPDHASPVAVGSPSEALWRRARPFSDPVTWGAFVYYGPPGV